MKSFLFVLLMFSLLLTSCGSSKVTIHGEIDSHQEFTNSDISTATRILSGIKPGNYYHLKSSNPHSHRESIHIINMGSYTNVIKVGDKGTFILEVENIHDAEGYENNALVKREITFYKLIEFKNE